MTYTCHHKNPATLNHLIFLKIPKVKTLAHYNEVAIDNGIFKTPDNLGTVP